jgi:hypothetical protein
MQERNEEQQQPKDKHLDIPAVANEEKHINFLDEEEKSSTSGNTGTINTEDKERRKEWQEGLEAGKRESLDELPFEKRELNEEEEDR